MITSFRLSEINTSLEFITRKQSLEHETTCYRNTSWQRKAWHEATISIDQKSLTDHKPKRIRKYDGTHVNIASYVNRFSKQSMTLTELRRHLRELDALTTEHFMIN